MRAYVIPVIALFTTASLLMGCGEGAGVPVEGKLVNGDKPYSKATDGDVSITLSGDEGKGETCTAKPAEDGTFKVQGQEGRTGMKPGKYKVSVTIYPANPDTSKGPPTPQTKTLAEPIEVTASTKTLTIDLAKFQ